MKPVESESQTRDPVSQSVVEAVAGEEEMDPSEFTPPLYEAIDPDALNRLFINHRTRGKVVFNYHRCEVSVFADGDVSVKTIGETTRPT